MDEKEIIPPAVLNEKQIKVAQQFVKMRFDGLSVEDACKAIPVSTATLYKWKAKQPVFASYMNALESSMVNEDEREAYKNVKAYIIRMVNVKNPSDKHVDMFMKHFEYVVNAENARRMAELGIITDTKDFKTVEERKASLLTRLKG